MTSDKSNSSSALETIIRENSNLRQSIHDVIVGKSTIEDLKSAIDYQDDIDDQFISTQWWFAPKITRETETKQRDDSRNSFISKITGTNIKSIFAQKGYKFDGRTKDYVVNIVGVRTSDSATNVFNDFLWLGYWYRGHLVEKVYNITTDPGGYWLSQQPLNSAGTAILVPGQYADKYTIRKHRGEYDALCQKWDTTVRVYRDNDKDGKLDFDAKIGTAGGINIHRASKVDKLYKVDSHSAGCQVFQDPRDFNEFMSVCYKHRDHFENEFTYTLLTERDFQ